MRMTAVEYKFKVSEHSLQVSLIEFLERNKKPNISYHAIPNAGLRSRRMGARMSNEGLRAGVADLCIMLPAGKVAWLEMKSAKGRQSIEQKGFGAICARIDHPYCVARTMEEAVAFLNKVGALK